MTAAFLWLACACAGDATDPAAPDAEVVAPVDAGEPDAGVPDAGEPDAGVESATWSDVQSILSNRCRPCHLSTNREGRVVVARYSAIVDATHATTGLTLVTPFFPSESLLYRKISGTQAQACADNALASGLCGSRMPPPTSSPLNATQIATVKVWIEAGAAED